MLYTAVHPAWFHCEILIRICPAKGGSIRKLQDSSFWLHIVFLYMGPDINRFGVNMESIKTKGLGSFLCSDHQKHIPPARILAVFSTLQKRNRAISPTWERTG